MITRLTKRAIRSWQSWRSKRRIYRELPELRYFDEAERQAKRSHSRVKHIRKAREEFMRNMLGRV